MTEGAATALFIPMLPLVAAAIISLLPRRAARASIWLSLCAMAGALALSLWAFASTLTGNGGGAAGPRTLQFDWFSLGTGVVRLGILLDPLGAIMLVMVSLVGLLIFIFSTSYMAHDDNVTRFFGFMSLFAAAMLGLVIANSLLLLFVCWEVMGLASYLLIGFWFEKPSAAAAAKKAFIVTRIGDLGLFLGMIWLYGATGTLLFHDGGNGCLEAAALSRLAGTEVATGLSVAGAISLLMLLGAIGKSGQVPLHVWLPDAMEGPTPVSALIHAATMVAAGVFLVARVYPLMAEGIDPGAGGTSPGLYAVTVIGAVTAVFAALLAVAQTDIKRILAYSTVSQLGYMFLGLGTGGVAVAMFHLITHAFFKALLFLGAGSVIHGCHGEQDIRRMGGLRRMMPWTFACYAVGMMALAGVPLVFSGFWSKDEILHAALVWAPAKWPFALALFGAFLTAFYMTRQMGEVFFGTYRGGTDAGHDHGGAGHAAAHPPPHESPPPMLVPLFVLAVFAVLLGLIGTPAWPWFDAYVTGHRAEFNAGRLVEAIPLMLISTAVVAGGIGLGWWLYLRRPRQEADSPDVLEGKFPRVYGGLHNRWYVDELYDATVVRLHRVSSLWSSWADKLLIGGLVAMTGAVFKGLAWLARWLDEYLVNPAFDAGCALMRSGGYLLSRLQAGRLQGYLGGLVLGMVVLTLLLVWGLGSGSP